MGSKLEEQLEKIDKTGEAHKIRVSLPDENEDDVEQNKKHIPVVGLVFTVITLLLIIVNLVTDWKYGEMAPPLLFTSVITTIVSAIAFFYRK